MTKDFKLTYLYVFLEESSRQAYTKPTEADITLVKSGCLLIYRWYVNAYEQMVVRDGKAVWEKVEEAQIYNDAEDEIGEYHA